MFSLYLLFLYWLSVARGMKTAVQVIKDDLLKNPLMPYIYTARPEGLVTLKVNIELGGVIRIDEKTNYI